MKINVRKSKVAGAVLLFALILPFQNCGSYKVTAGNVATSSASAGAVAGASADPTTPASPSPVASPNPTATPINPVANPPSATAPALTPAAPPVVATPVVSTPVVNKLKSYRVMPLGDSITYGVGDSSGGSGYRGLLYDSLSAQGYTLKMVGEHQPDDARLANEGNPGWTIVWTDLYAVSGSSNVVAKYQPDVAIILLGTNDIEQQQDLANVSTRMSKLLTDIRASAPKISCIIASIPPLTDPALNAQVVTLNASIKQFVAQERAAGRPVVFADLNAALTTADLTQDGIHPSHQGYLKIAEVLRATFAANF